jgi:hypothetical protein
VRYVQFLHPQTTLGAHPGALQHIDLRSSATWHRPCLTKGQEVSTTSPKSGRSKKGGAGTSVRLRKLRGRSTTSLTQTARLRRAVLLFPLDVSIRQAAARDQQTIFVRVQEMARRKDQSGEGHRNPARAGSFLRASHRRGTHRPYSDRYVGNLS